MFDELLAAHMHWRALHPGLHRSPLTTAARRPQILLTITSDITTDKHSSNAAKTGSILKPSEAQGDT